MRIDQQKQGVSYLDKQELIESIEEIAEIIIMEMPLRYQDKWVQKMYARGLVKTEMRYTPEED